MRVGGGMAKNNSDNNWTLNSALERLKAELDSTVHFWLQHSHDKKFGYVLFHFVLILIT